MRKFTTKFSNVSKKKTLLVKAKYWEVVVVQKNYPVKDKLSVISLVWINLASNFKNWWMI